MMLDAYPMLWCEVCNGDRPHCNDLCLACHIGDPGDWVNPTTIEETLAGGLP